MRRCRRTDERVVGRGVRERSCRHRHRAARRRDREHERLFGGSAQRHPFDHGSGCLHLQRARRRQRATRRAQRCRRRGRATLGRSLHRSPLTSSTRAIAPAARQAQPHEPSSRNETGRAVWPAPSGQSIPPVLLDGGRDALDVAELEVLELRGDRGLDRGGNPGAPLADADTVDLRAVGDVLATQRACPSWRSGSRSSQRRRRA